MIFNGRAAYDTNNWEWKKYTGSNKHISHLHISVGRDTAQYDSNQSWKLLTSAPYVPPIKKKDEMSPEMWLALNVRLNEIQETQKSIIDVLYGEIDKKTGTRGEGILHYTMYLRQNLLSGDNAAELDHILEKFGNPPK